MNMVPLADAKAHLGDLIAQAEAGETVCITKRGKPVAQLTAVQPRRRPISLAELQAVTDAMPMQSESAGDFVRGMRDGERY
ncbi:prevent-host-death protein [Azospirillum thiophilum]|uniref:Antitoxin n=1 Tax=Azospirillum thiophilum TaxID=528244 RepID=A0AAC8ZSX2_9PROT|nr:type II toxin-antitoxin system prevent-host-death family antitoxin [Azospirillum thiophilum]ALG69758.1 prevent-host-death protein [Azospirillum thiophilum]KJR66557.1 prevent-host-death protein [Azospirillum thiophilum]